jgi:hypothetical protein
MGIFSRRAIQRMLNENAAFLTREQLKEKISRLNKGSFQSLETEWEVAVLNAFSKIGQVQHEPNLNGTSKLDLLFVSDRDTHAQMIADIATVSDEGFERENPGKFFHVAFDRQIQKTGLRANSFGYVVHYYPLQDIDKIKLMLPPRGEFGRQIFNDKFRRFIGQMKANPSQTYNYKISTAQTNILITYDPHQKFFSASCPTYTRPISKDRNPVYNALKGKAQKQFKNLSFGGPRGIILCDGASRMFLPNFYTSMRGDYTASDAVNEFLRQNKSIDFVLALCVTWEDKRMSGAIWGFYPGASSRKIKVELFRNDNFNNLPIGLRDSLSELEKHFPIPVNVAGGARETIRHGFDTKKFRPLRGGFQVKSKEIKVSANDVLALLAGVVTQEQLFKSNPHIRGSFEHFLSRKMRIVEVKVEETPYDESYLVFMFDGPDPAISPFKNPKDR